MLSNPTPRNLHPRQRQHRRQNSTPSAFEAVKIGNLPNLHRQPAQSHASSHRRGLSLDTRRHQPIMASPATAMRQDLPTVSTTNPGLSSTTQHVLREAQQQRIARPGPGQPFANMAHDENFLISPQGTPHSQRFDTACFEAVGAGQQPDCMSVPYNAYSGPINIIIKKNLTGFASNMASSQDFELFAPDSALSTPTFVSFHESPAGSQGWMSEGETASTGRTSRRISNGIMDRVAKFESMEVGGQRPVTPPNQNAASYFPPTPKETPHDRMANQEARLGRFSDDYDESMEETIKPPRNCRSNRSSGIFVEMRQQAEDAMVVPQRANTMPMAVSTADFMNMSNVNAEFMKIENSFEDYVPQLSQDSTPDIPRHLLAGQAFNNKPDLRPPDFDSQSTVSPFGQLEHSPTQSAATSRRGSPHRRTESLASIASAASIASINIEDTKTETGVSTDDIAAFIEGPDAADGKWTCLYDGCGKRFGRKENIKSHVQTHLNDRQYQCPSCHKCFVRQHDLKRHAKIHTGIKPYPCDCGNTFARHDALTRHRQRGMCVGAFDGIVRKVVKRGRPRKHRPDMSSRMEKSARTRSKNNKTSGSSPSASSQSCYSDSSAPNSPPGDFEGGFDTSTGFPDMMDVAMTGVESGSSTATAATMNPSALAVSSAPMPSLAATSTVMGEGLGHMSPEHVGSPSAMSHYSRVSIAGEDMHMDELPAQPSSPAKSVASHYTQHPNTPPELSASSSPPSSSARFFDLDPNSSYTEESIGLSAPLASGCGGGGVDVGHISSSSLEEDLLKAFTTDDVLVQLDSSGLGMLNSKFDEEYGMFTNGDDVFFGSS